MAITVLPGNLIVLREAPGRKWVVVYRCRAKTNWGLFIGGGKVVAVKDNLDSYTCHQLDHIEILADAASKTGEYSVELHCQCGRYSDIPKKEWEAIAEKLQADAEEPSPT